MESRLSRRLFQQPDVIATVPVSTRSAAASSGCVTETHQVIDVHHVRKVSEVSEVRKVSEVPKATLCTSATRSDPHLRANRGAKGG